MNQFNQYNELPNYQQALKMTFNKKTPKTYYDSEFVKVLNSLASYLKVDFSLRRYEKITNANIYLQYKSIYDDASALMQLSKYDYNVVKDFANKLFSIILGSHLVLLTIKLKNRVGSSLEKKLDSYLLDI